MKGLSLTLLIHMFMTFEGIFRISEDVRACGCHRRHR